MIAEEYGGIAVIVNERWLLWCDRGWNQGWKFASKT